MRDAARPVWNVVRDHVRGRLPEPWRLKRFALALAIGTAGGAAFTWLGVPLSWLLGAMLACLVAAVAGAPIAPVNEVRPLMMAVIGTMIGAGFSPDLLAGLGGRVVSLTAVFAYVIVCAGVGSAYFILVGGFDRATAYFSSLPGGMIEMAVLGQQNGGDMRRIALVHASRVFLVVISLPTVMTWLHGSAPAPVARAATGDAPLATYAWLVACVAAGMWLGRRLRLPICPFLGPMALSAAVHIAGLNAFHVPRGIVVVAQVVLGTLVGCSFLGASRGLVLHVLALSAGSVLIYVLTAAAFAYAMSAWLGLNLEALILSYAPGGMAEMGLVALSLNIEAAFVALHHVTRILFVLVAAGWLLRFAGRAASD